MIGNKKENMIDIGEIGRGIFGVSHVITTSTGFFAMKMLDYDVRIKENCKKLIGKPNYPAIAKYIHYFEKITDEDNLLLITDLYTKGSLFDFISLSKAKAKGFTFFQIELEFTLAYGISKGLEFLHSNQIVHGNLTSKNILIDKDSRPHLDGFMYERIYDDDDELEKKDYILNYTAPEILIGDSKSKKVNPTTYSDIYSLGMILYEILTGQSPFQEFDSYEVLKNKIINGFRPTTDTIYDPFIPIIESCWNPNPNERPTAADVCKKIHQIATSINSLAWFNTYGQSMLKDLTYVDKNFEGYWKNLSKVAQTNESHLAMFIVGIMCLKDIMPNSLQEEAKNGLQFLLISSDSFVYAMKKVIELKENNVINEVEGFNFEDMLEAIDHFQSRSKNSLAQIHYNLFIDKQC